MFGADLYLPVQPQNKSDGAVGIDLVMLLFALVAAASAGIIKSGWNSGWSSPSYISSGWNSGWSPSYRSYGGWNSGWSSPSYYRVGVVQK
uniref:Uncharacterized protein n=1 Tax=Megaselia scalaris TaxID=36166 RepID=T1GNB2_MEGSC